MTAPAYAIAYLTEIRIGDEIKEYIRRIDSTVDAFGGHFVIHGGDLTAMEGEWPGDIIMIAFPSKALALEWYASPEYQDILALRTEHSEGIAAIVEGVPAGYRAVAKLDQLPA
ncbi:DUF1330 domain-containing protein [Luteipulveratus mongoliensis]|uniref:DUF1330 domain-containing protein n=1 Tax=Luteipulveratus mongoliensis TaxID=571913 RepID=A0A0K1JPH9_9MICO|nr:DUF1330 domain-containing protein [Luteipulveratus mongoliensis]AKU18498.1 hypothetical protein VV02_00265 [Luteipulveratus mongoliensis]